LSFLTCSNLVLSCLVSSDCLAFLIVSSLKASSCLVLFVHISERCFERNQSFQRFFLEIFSWRFDHPRLAPQGLKSQVHRLHPYVDETLELEKEMETKMRLMSSEEFEGVLHPIFEEDELTLIVVGGVLGMTAGFLQAMAPY
jgi:hypothetical protein